VNIVNALFFIGLFSLNQDRTQKHPIKVGTIKPEKHQQISNYSFILNLHQQHFPIFIVDWIAGDPHEESPSCDGMFL
jgi:hypothetical protein